MPEPLGIPSDDSAGTSVDLGTVVDLLDSAGVAVAVLDSHTVVQRANAAFAQACGRPAEELVAARLTDRTVGDDAAPLGAVVAEVADGASGAAGHATEARMVGADGAVRPLRLHMGLVPGNGSALVLCVAHDRSEDRRRERSERSARVARARAESTDPETGLPNRRGLDEALASAVRRSRNNLSPHALIRCEIGSAQGDDPMAVRACVERIRQRLRPADTVARIEDGVVAVVAEDLQDEQDAVGVAYRLLSTVVEPVPGEDGPVQLTMVAGVAMADGDTPPHALVSASVEAAADAGESGGFVLMDLRQP